MVLLGKATDDGLITHLLAYVEGGKYTGVIDRASLHRVDEGELINTNVTLPAALAALSLIFLRSNNIGVAQRIAVQDSLVCYRKLLILHQQLNRHSVFH